MPKLKNTRDEYLIVAANARYMVESALRGGFKVSAIDCFGDRETLAGTRRHYKIATSELANTKTLQDICRNWSSETGSRKIVPGPGLEANPEIVEKLTNEWDFFGNSTKVFSVCHDRKPLEKTLSKLAIPHPAKNPKYRQLRKTAGSSGGVGVSFAKASSKDYCQSYIPGCNISHLFAATNGVVRTIGFSAMWTVARDPETPFLHGGAINRAPLQDGHKMECEKYATKLARSYDLVGINSLDYALCASNLYCIELNPRPSATMQLYDGAHGQTMFAAHLAACRGILPSKAKSLQTKTKAYAIFYCDSHTEIPKDFSWPREASDTPSESGVFQPGEPLCTLRQEGDNVSETLSRLQKSKLLLRQKIKLLNL